MRQSLFFAFVGVFITINVTSHAWKIHEYPSNLAWLFGMNKNLDETKEDKLTVCQTEECQKIAKVIRESMDKSVDPCYDFYEYACGKWSENNPIPEGETEWSLWDIIKRNIEEQIQDILKAGFKHNELLAVKLAKRWYMACMDIDAMEKRGLEPLVSTLSRIGGWPIIMESDEWNEQEYSWQKVDDQYMRLMGKNTFHDLSVFHSNQTEKIINIDTPHLPVGAYALWSESENTSNEDKSDEDSSDEEEQKHKRKLSDEWENSQEPQTESKNNEDSDEIGENKRNNKNNDIDDDDDINKQNNEKQTTVRTKVFNHKKIKNSLQAKKKKDHAQFTRKKNMAMKHRTKRRIIKTMNDNKIPRNFIHRKKLNTRKRERDHLNKRDRKKIDKIETTHTSTTPQFSTEETNDEIKTKLQSYVEYISKVARAIAKERGVSISEEHLDNNIKDMVDFQLKLTEITMESGEEANMTLDDFQAWYNKKKPKTFSGMINWVYKITELFDEANVPVDGSLQMEVESPDYFEALISLLDETPNRTIVNYIHWNFLSKMITTTTNEMRELYDSWREVKKKDRKQRSSNCIKEVEMSDILAYEYVSEYFSDNITKTAMDMIDDIQKEVEYQIKESDWMDDDTKDHVLTKLINMKKFVGYPDWYRNNTIMKRYFQGLVIDTSYYENTLSFSRYIRWKKLRQLTEHNNVETWWINPVTLNALFMPTANSLFITAADFQSPWFTYNRPQTINYGIIGFVMSHEVNHGFDDTGRMYDKNGDFMEWLSAMAEAYGKRAECFVEQFNNYPIDKVTNKTLENYGNQTADENIADTMGLQAVFRAYQRRERECGKPNTALPGLEEFTNDQLFFLSFANLWCETINSSIAMASAKYDVHSTGRLRVIGSISNSEDFAKAYNCPSNSPMNPPKKCNIWK